MPLTTAAIENARPGITPQGRTTAKSYKIGDSAGLYLQVTPAGGKWWRLKYRFGGKEKGLSLGVYPEVSLTDARRSRDHYRALLAEGVDPKGDLLKNIRVFQDKKNIQMVMKKGRIYADPARLRQERGKRDAARLEED